ncbi:hypothetical protein [Spirosoma telluris]|uniref:hypothetical protein n=1 Tax=Spirosoma telluris TaxID=2183553 RepID=UPI002FC30931
MFLNTNVVRQVFRVSRNLPFEGFTFEIIIDQKDEIAFIIDSARSQNFVELGKTPRPKTVFSTPLKFLCVVCVGAATIVLLSRIG